MSCRLIAASTALVLAAIAHPATAEQVTLAFRFAEEEPYPRALGAHFHPQVVMVSPALAESMLRSHKPTSEFLSSLDLAQSDEVPALVSTRYLSNQFGMTIYNQSQIAVQFFYGRWSEWILLPTRPYIQCAEFPFLFVDDDGSISVTFITRVQQGEPEWAIWLIESVDGGRTWSRPEKILEPDGTELEREISSHWWGRNPHGDGYLMYFAAAQHEGEADNRITRSRIRTARSSDRRDWNKDPGFTLEPQADERLASRPSHALINIRDVPVRYASSVDQVEGHTVTLEVDATGECSLLMHACAWFDAARGYGIRSALSSNREQWTRIGQFRTTPPAGTHEVYPSLVRTPDGRLVVFYGLAPYGGGGLVSREIIVERIIAKKEEPPALPAE